MPCLGSLSRQSDLIPQHNRGSQSPAICKHKLGMRSHSAGAAAEGAAAVPAGCSTRKLLLTMLLGAEGPEQQEHVPGAAKNAAAYLAALRLLPPTLASEQGQQQKEAGAAVHNPRAAELRRGPAPGSHSEWTAQCATLAGVGGRRGGRSGQSSSESSSEEPSPSFTSAMHLASNLMSCPTWSPWTLVTLLMMRAQTAHTQPRSAGRPSRARQAGCEGAHPSHRPGPSPLSAPTRPPG